MLFFLWIINMSRNLLWTISAVGLVNPCGEERLQHEHTRKEAIVAFLSSVICRASFTSRGSVKVRHIYGCILRHCLSWVNMLDTDEVDKLKAHYLLFILFASLLWSYSVVDVFVFAHQLSPVWPAIHCTEPKMEQSRRPDPQIWGSCLPVSWSASPCVLSLGALDQSLWCAQKKNIWHCFFWSGALVLSRPGFLVP